MAWIRLDDQIAHHPKFLKAGLSAWLWVCCIGFAQKFLTDGHVPYEAIATLAGGIERPQNHIEKLVKVGLLDKAAGGYQIHHYLDFNDSAETVKRKREADRVRKESERTPKGIRADSERNPSAVLARAPASHPIPSHPSDKNNKLVSKAGVSTTSEKPPAPPNGNGLKPLAEIDARSKHPVFKGQRIVVFDWMLEDIRRLLGDHMDAFDIHEWFFTLDAQAVKSGAVVPQRDKGVWLHAQTLREAQRRGLPIVVTPSTENKLGKIGSRIAEMLASLPDEELKHDQPKRLR